MRTPCDCEHVHDHSAGSEVADLGVDPRNGRFGQVTVYRCAACGAHWLHYLVNDDQIDGYLALRNRTDGTVREEKFVYRRVK